MNRAYSLSLCLASLLASVAAVRGEDAKPRTDLYGDPLPPGTVARLGMRPFPSVVGGEALTFSVDGRYLFSADSDGQVLTWDAATGELRRRRRLAWKRQKDHDSLETIVLSPDGSRLAAWDRKNVYVYDTAKGRELGRYTALDSFTPPLLKFSPDGKKLLLQRREEFGLFADIYLWDVRASYKKPRLKKLSCPDGTILSDAAFTPDGRRVAGLEVNLRIWDTTTGREVSKSDKDFREAYSLRFSPDGKTLALLATSPSRVDLLEAATLKKRATMPLPKESKDWDLADFALSPDGRLLAAPYPEPGKDGGILLWDMAEKKLRWRLSNMVNCNKTVFSPDGKTLGCHRDNHAISVLDVATGRQRNPRPSHMSFVMTLAVSADGRTVASGDGAGELHLWDAATSKPLRAWKASEATIHHCWFSPDGKRLISLDEKEAVCAWDTATGKKLWRGSIKSSPTPDGSGGFSADGKRLFLALEPLSGDTPIQLSIWDTDTGKLLRQRSYEPAERAWTPPGRGLDWRVDRLAFAPDGASLFARQGIEDVLTGRKLTALPGDIGSRAAFSPDGRYLAATIWQPQKEKSQGFWQNGLALLEMATGEEIFRWQTGTIDYVAFTPDGRAVVTADTNQVCVWDADTGRRWHQMRWPAIANDDFTFSDPLCFAVLPGGRIATGMGGLGPIFVWDLAPSTWAVPKPAGDLDRKELDALWSDLAGNARGAYRAIGRLASVPARTVPFLRTRLQPVTVDTKRIEKLLANLDSDSFEAREAAGRELTRIRYRIEPMLRQALEGNPSLEMRRRLQAILAEPKRPPREVLRTMRAIAVLERIATVESRRILEKLSTGAAARETQEAKAALQRLNRR
ncbi:MAG TPA: WD40 repeat domain-containing protein [Gemmataceae bacterium]|nr:WD40 repeat domain-containing protein [Gemmataceae bacterium]